MSGMIEPKIAERIYLDTNVFVEVFEGRRALSRNMSELLTRESVITRFVTSELTLSELMVKPFEMKREDLISAYDNWTISNSYLEVIPIIRDVLRYAAQLRARDKTLKLPNAIHLAIAIHARCRYFLTGDNRIKGQFGVEIVDLNEANIQALLSAK